MHASHVLSLESMPLLSIPQESLRTGVAGKAEPGEQQKLKRLSKHRDAAPPSGPFDSLPAATAAPDKMTGNIQR